MTTEPVNYERETHRLLAERDRLAADLDKERDKVRRAKALADRVRGSVALATLEGRTLRATVPLAELDVALSGGAA
jgi:hypothetical protein